MASSTWEEKDRDLTEFRGICQIYLWGEPARHTYLIVRGTCQTSRHQFWPSMRYFPNSCRTWLFCFQNHNWIPLWIFGAGLHAAQSQNKTIAWWNDWNSEENQLPWNCFKIAFPNLGWTFLGNHSWRSSFFPTFGQICCGPINARKFQENEFSQQRRR